MGAAISPVVRALEEAWDEIRVHHHEIPHVVIIVASGHEGRRKKYGHHSKCRWVEHEQGEALTEIMVSGEGLNRGPVAVMATLLHESAHALADARGVQDTSRQGRYHNKQFRSMALEVGIEVERDDTIGWSVTTMGTLGEVRYAKQIEAIGQALTLHRASSLEVTALPGGGGGGGGSRSSNYTKAVCDCERVVRLAPSTLEAGPVLCGLCQSEFVQVI
jgi:hypothetical protein